MVLGYADRQRMGQEESMTMEDAPTPWHCCSTRTRVEFGGKNRRSQVFSKKMIQNTGRQVRSDEEKNNGQ
jgi:hypothetical protein